MCPGQSWGRLQSLGGDRETSGITASLGFSSLHKARQLLEEGHLMSSCLPSTNIAQRITQDSLSLLCPKSLLRGQRRCLLKDQPGRSAMPFARWSAEGAQWKPSANPPNDIFSQGWGQELGKGTAGQRETFISRRLWRFQLSGCDGLNQSHQSGPSFRMRCSMTASFFIGEKFLIS